MTESEIIESILAAATSGKPLCYVLTIKAGRKSEPVMVRRLPVFWQRSNAMAAARELSKLTGRHFVVAEARVRPGKGSRSGSGST